MDGNNMNNMENQTAEYTYAAEGTYNSYEEPAAGGSNALAIVSLVCGILGLVCCGGGIVSIAAIICGAMGKSRCPRAGMAKTGMILGIVGVVLSVLAVIIYCVLVALGVASEMSYYM